MQMFNPRSKLTIRYGIQIAKFVRIQQTPFNKVTVDNGLIFATRQLNTVAQRTGTNKGIFVNRLCKDKASIYGSYRCYSDDNGARMSTIDLKNPLRWILDKWYIYRVRRFYDPDFNEIDFIKGTRQAVCTVAQFLSTEQFDHLTGIVEQEVLQWLKIKTLAMDKEQKYIMLDLRISDFIITRMNGLKLIENKEETILFIDTSCIAVMPGKMKDEPAFIINLGFRFKRHYGSESAGDWSICGVSQYKIFKLLKAKSFDDIGRK